MTRPADSAFRDRARYEAARYGADAWVFVRELLQNARDAGARRVWLETSRVDGSDRVSCRDDGEGMSFEHARRYLFTLYASSKRGRPHAAGRFGIGFWSVLRFAPETLLIRSHPRRGPGWQVRLDADLAVSSVSVAAMERGTEVVLERRADGSDIELELRQAVLRDAPFVGRRGAPGLPLEVRVNGELVRRELELPPPSLAFRRRGLRGAVGLAVVPRVEIFAHGLKVRDAASLEELLLAGGAGRRSRAGAAGLLAPTALIDSHQLSVLMARGDALEDRALRRLVAIGNRELGRLIRAELDRHVRLNPVQRALEAVRDVWSSERWLRAALVGAALVVPALLAWDRLAPGQGGEPAAMTPPAAEERAVRPAPPYRGLEGRYAGPDVDSVARAAAAIDLGYRPHDARPHLAALVLDGLDEAGRPVQFPARDLRPYRGAPCEVGCLELEIAVAAGPGLLRLPLATGHAVDPLSVRLDGAGLEVLEADDGRPVLLLDAPVSGVLRYRSGPAVAGGPGASGTWPPLPAELRDRLAGAGARTPTEVAAEAAALVARTVRYDVSPAVIEGHRAARSRGLDVFQRAVAVGAGDCDVQNAILAAVLDASGVPARLAVGWLGAEGRALPGLHAWVEFEGEDGRWRVADASAVPAPGQAVATLPQPRPTRWPPSRRQRALALVAVVLAAAGAAVLLLGRGWRRELRPGTADDIAGLLRGAAARPAAFAGAGRLFRRRVVPLVGGRRVSLSRAQSAARNGRLAGGTAGLELARRAAAAGGLVIDTEAADGGAVAGALGAVDLDTWQHLLARSRSEAVCEAVERALAAVGEPCRVRVAGSVGEDTAVLIGPQFALPASATRVVLDEDADLWRAVAGAAAEWPARAALLLAHVVTERLGVPERRRRRCLATLAAEALIEAGGGPA